MKINGKRQNYQLNQGGGFKERKDNKLERSVNFPKLGRY